ncbi:CoA:oxalate CoA-transferase [Dethiosulfatibacter aminovorans DSM 17477]|uniref:CoA:oxalate CoA-transferase n=1 Tax=Dethiosulfatibacter aminovorans DSM 17477 TaxID=1121476 RepID=A0A1M6EY96_9FIRM|nr:CoA transferase [Dethiosulfatibacter aminovorans]SHI90437.1 CoA:oxalate CoA-transferase [Dethiosulfatibacter aminovorans DSM 17477]
MAKALEGIRVIEYASGAGVPYASKLLADMGADVIKIEPLEGDKSRHIAPFVGNEANVEKSCLFLYANSNKRSITLDLETVEGVNIFKDLVKGADVLVRQGPPEYFNSKGLSYEELSKDNEGLILSSNTLLGESGPYKDYAATNFTVSHMTGGTVLYPHGTGDGDRAPVIMGANMEAFDAGPISAIGILAALHWRFRSGKGQYIENCALDAGIAPLTTETVIFPVFGQNFDRSGETQRLQSSLNFECKDGYLGPFFAQQNEFDNLARTVGKEEWIGQEWFTDMAQRRARCEEISDAMKEFSSKYSKAEAVEIFQSNKVPIGPVDTPAEVVNSPHYNERGFFIDIEHPVAGKMKYPGRPFIMSKTPHTYNNPAPLLGADTDEILKNVLGYDEEKIADLRKSNII